MRTKSDRNAQKSFSILSSESTSPTRRSRLHTSISSKDKLLTTSMSRLNASPTVTRFSTNTVSNSTYNIRRKMRDIMDEIYPRGKTESETYNSFLATESKAEKKYEKLELGFNRSSSKNETQKPRTFNRPISNVDSNPLLKLNMNEYFVFSPTATKKNYLVHSNYVRNYCESKRRITMFGCK